MLESEWLMTIPLTLNEMIMLLHLILLHQQELVKLVKWNTNSTPNTELIRLHLNRNLIKDDVLHENIDVDTVLIRLDI